MLKTTKMILAAGAVASLVLCGFGSLPNVSSAESSSVFQVTVPRFGDAYSAQTFDVAPYKLLKASVTNSEGKKVNMAVVNPGNLKKVSGASWHDFRQGTTKDIWQNQSLQVRYVKVAFDTGVFSRVRVEGKFYWNN